MIWLVGDTKVLRSQKGSPIHFKVSQPETCWKPQENMTDLYELILFLMKRSSIWILGLQERTSKCSSWGALATEITGHCMHVFFESFITTRPEGLSISFREYQKCKIWNYSHAKHIERKCFFLCNCWKSFWVKFLEKKNNNKNMKSSINNNKTKQTMKLLIHCTHRGFNYTQHILDGSSHDLSCQCLLAVTQ